MRQQRKSTQAWGELLGRLEGYAGTQAEFCTEHGITLWSLRYHLSRRAGLRDAGGKQPVPGFVHVGSVGQAVTVAGENIELAVGPIRIRVGPKTDMALLGQVLRASVEACGRT